MDPSDKSAPTFNPPTFFRVTMIFVIIAGWLAAWSLPWQYIWQFKTCVFRRIAGIPCPFCDLTHACVYFAHGRLIQSIEANALGPLIMIASLALLLFFGNQVFRKAPAFPLDRFLALRPWIKYAALVVLIINWSLQIAKHMSPQ